MTGKASAMDAGARIARFAAGFSRRQLTGAQRKLAYRALLDTVAVAAAGVNEPAVMIMRDYVTRLGAGGSSRAWVTGERLAPEFAALLNAVAAHVLDYDDVMTPMRAHVSATLVPALTALAGVREVTGGQYAAAFIAGFEVMAKFAHVMALDHYSKGWHSTSALGVLGTTTACAVLLGLDETQIVNALGLAVAQAAGSRENFGFMAKSFQAAQCAQAAVRAALLAQAGFDAAPTAIDGRYGYMSLYAGREDMGPALSQLGEGELEIVRTGLDVKKYPCCYALHRGLDALFTLRREHGLTLDAVERIDVLTSARGLEALITGEPLTGLEAKFSMPYALTVGLRDGAIDFAAFADAALALPEPHAWFDRIHVVEAAGPVLPRWTEIRLTLRDGRELALRVQVAHGDAPDPLTDDELTQKARDCFALAQLDMDAGAWSHRVLNMTDLALGEVLI